MKVLRRNKWLPVLISIIFTMVLFAGCGNNNKDEGDGPGNISIGGDSTESRETEPATSAQDHYETYDMNSGWPSELLPPGFPEYPGGDQYYDGDEIAVLLYILETDNNTFNDYMAALKSFGFEFDAGVDESGFYNAKMGLTKLSISFNEEWGTTGMILFNTRPEKTSAEWPSALPDYPDGDKYVSVNSKGDLYTISISNTSKASMEKYIDTLKKSGWAQKEILGVERTGEFGKTGYDVSLRLNEDGTTLTIFLFVLTEYESLPAVWPTAHLPSGFPEYPDGTIVEAILGGDGSVAITVSETDMETVDAYQAALENAGWIFSEKDEDWNRNGKKDGMWVSLLFSTTNTLMIMVG